MVKILSTPDVMVVVAAVSAVILSTFNVVAVVAAVAAVIELVVEPSDFDDNWLVGRFL